MRPADLALALTLLFAVACPCTRAADHFVEGGRRIYEEGITQGGVPLRAVSAGNSTLSGAQAACTACHRSSGMGSREGRVAVSPITGPILYAKPEPFWPRRPGRDTPAIKPLRQDARSAYDDASLARSIRSGVDASGTPLDALMPRYELGEADMQALIAYLRQHSAAPPPGLDGNGLHLATIVTPDADPARVRLLTETLTAWSHSGALGGMPMDLQVWRLEGEPIGWTRQLHDLYARRPVYAILSGAGRARWAPVRDFCEQAAVPCLFPIVDLAPDDAQDFYSLYLSRGVPLEARILARQLKEELEPPAARVVQLFDDEAGEQSAHLLAEHLGEAAQNKRAWRSESPASVIADLGPSDVVVGWLSPAHLNALAQLRPEGLGVRLALFSGQLAPPEKTELPWAWRREARWVSLRSDPQRVRGKGVLGLAPWLSQLQLPPSDDAMLAEVYAATYFFGDALARMRGQWNREYLLETLESAHYTRPAGSAYFALSLAPGQREAAKAGYLLGFAGPELRQVVPMGPRLSP
jgi:Cytochrome c